MELHYSITPINYKKESKLFNSPEVLPGNFISYKWKHLAGNLSDSYPFFMRGIIQLGIALCF